MQCHSWPGGPQALKKGSSLIGPDSVPASRFLTGPALASFNNGLTVVRGNQPFSFQGVLVRLDHLRRMQTKTHGKLSASQSTPQPLLDLFLHCGYLGSLSKIFESEVLWELSLVIREEWFYKQYSQEESTLWASIWGTQKMLAIKSPTISSTNLGGSRLHIWVVFIPKKTLSYFKLTSVYFNHTLSLFLSSHKSHVSPCCCVSDYMVILVRSFPILINISILFTESCMKPACCCGWCHMPCVFANSLRKLGFRMHLLMHSFEREGRKSLNP